MDHPLIIVKDSNTCRDFVYFLRLLSENRRIDDTVPQMLNIKDPKAKELRCRQVYEYILKVHMARLESLRFCRDTLLDEASNTDKFVFEKQVCCRTLPIYLVSIVDYLARFTVDNGANCTRTNTPNY